MAVRRPGPEDLQAIARQFHFSIPEERLPSFQALVEGVPCPLRPARRAGGAAAGAAPSPRRGAPPQSEENPLGPERGGPASRAPDGPLTSRTLEVKDNIAVAGVPMRNGRVLLDGYVADEDATMVERCWTPAPPSWARRSARACASPGQPHRRSVYGRTAAAGEARDEVHDAAQDRPDPIWLGHHRREGLHPRRAHPARRQGGEAQEEAVQGRLRDLAHHLAGRGQARLPEGGRAAAHRRWPVRQGRAVGGGGCLLGAPPLPGGAAADAGGDPGLEPGRGRRHRHAPRDLLSQSPPRDQSAQDRSIATGGPCRTEAADAGPSLQRGKVPCGGRAGRSRPARSSGGPSSIATSRAADGWAAWERHTTRSLPSWAHSRVSPGQGQGSTSSSRQRRPQPGHHAVPAVELRRWPRSSGQTGHGSPHSGPWSPITIPPTGPSGSTTGEPAPLT